MHSVSRRRYSQQVAQHLTQQVTAGLDAFQDSAAWLGTTEPATGQYPNPYARPAGGSPRMYRSMHAPGGYNFYYHQADLVAAKAIGLKDAVSGYCAHFAANCVLNNGVFCWGSHYYWDCQANTLRRFVGNETPVAIDKTQAGDYEEIRPSGPAWDLLWAELGTSLVTNHIETITPLHIVNGTTGEFNRHTNSAGQMHAFLEWLAPQISALVFLYSKTNEPSHIATAQLMLDYVWAGRDATTGLVVNCRNSPTNRWDRFVSSTVCGVLAYHLLRAAEFVPANTASDWRAKAAGMVEPYLEYGWDDAEGKFYGQLLVTNGQPVFGVPAGTAATVFRPQDYTDPWVARFPSHDYPQHLALACCELLALGAEPVFRVAIQRFARQFVESLPGNSNARAFALHYAYIIWFYTRAAEVTGDSSYRKTAWIVAEEAISNHFVGPGFRSSNLPGWNEHGDGTGFLLLALLYLESGSEPELFRLVL